MQLKDVRARKAVAVHTIVLIIMMGMFAIAAFWLFMYWTGKTGVEATAATCTFKKIFYCEDWKSKKYGAEPWNWEDKPPEGCEEFGITKPTSPDDCKGLI